jgi:hypothetical protein
MLKELGTTILGSMEIVDDSLMITDPCYKGGDKVVENLKSGTWICETNIVNEGGWGNRNAYIAMYHMSHRYSHKKFELDVDYGEVVNVDSGQIGMFLGSTFETDSVSEDYYDEICNITGDSTCGGGPVRDNEGQMIGFATSSGFGDGGYDLFMKLDDITGEVIALEVVFIPQPNDPRFIDETDDSDGADLDTEEEDGYL